LSPAKFRHVSSGEDVKAHPRSEARRPKKAKAVVRAARASAKKAPAKKPAALSIKARTATRSASATNGKSTHALKAPAKAAAPSKSPAKVPVKTATPAKAAALAKAVPAKAAPAKAVPAKAAPAKAVPAKAAPAKAATPAKAAAAPKAAPPAAPPPPKKPARKSIKEAAGVSTDAVARRTGKNWDDWFEVLDSAGAANLDQRGVVAILAQKHGIGPWWQQMIAVGYESLRNKSDKPPAADGFQINSSCTLDAPLPRVFRLWNDAGERARWLADDRFVVRGATADKVIRARWGKGTSHVAVSFAEKSGRTEVSVEHHQIESRGAAEQMKAYWAKKLGLLDQALAPRR
jgi:hypothetical protein